VRPNDLQTAAPEALATPERTWSTGDVARALGVGAGTLHQWTYRGHLAPFLAPRERHTWRRFTSDEVAVMAAIRHLSRHMGAGVAAEVMETVLEHFHREWFEGIEACAREGGRHLWVFVCVEPVNATFYGGDDKVQIMDLLLTAPGSPALYDVGHAVYGALESLVRSEMSKGA